MNVQELDEPDCRAPLRYHWYVYGEVPPETVDVKVRDCPRSMMTEEGDKVTDGTAFTVTDAVLDCCVLAVGVAESVTLR